MIVRNEAEELAACLASVQGVVDEAIILDTGSEDSTIEIARNWGARVYEAPWPNDFAAARNLALRYVTTDWVLVLDADETLIPAVGAVLPNICQRPDLLVVTLVRQEVDAIPPYSQVSRLFRRHPELYFHRPYHESIDDSALALIEREPHWQIAHLEDIAIRHTGYRRDRLVARNKPALATKIMATYLAKHPQDAYICAKLGGLYLGQGELQEAEKTLKQGLRVGERPAQVSFELYYQLGNLYSYQQLWPEAIAHYQHCLETGIPPLTQVAAYLRLGEAQKYAKQWPQAISSYQAAIDRDPNLAIAYQNQAVLLFRLGQIPTALEQFRRAIALFDDQNPEEAQRLRQELRSIGFSLLS
ncbi:glycosyltransferase [Candidatus Synechococcus calcipolaris G9]|uniref:Glycosyltransferase n=1 Tax=Candidatus Synechococcus calcipolaris G9 TaxID=1497997 RepID=A0ABT6EW49_9SYNE|nr:glycosyltransferase [Candidatus Synechococcus calcipolaris]MDG2990012.1 glycosyltransferase [Candidatus Synechococcus calcipolaris G9]